jgi:hypothetical protein
MCEAKTALSIDASREQRAWKSAINSMAQVACSQIVEHHLLGRRLLGMAAVDDQDRAATEAPTANNQNDNEQSQHATSHSFQSRCCRVAVHARLE